MSSKVQHAQVAVIEVVAARDLKDKDALGKSDPYAKVILEAGDGEVYPEKFKTEVVEDNLNPEWNARSTFLVECGEPLKVKVELYDEDTGGDDSLGDFEFELQAGPTLDQWFPLSSKGEVHIRANLTQTGDIASVHSLKESVGNLQARVEELEAGDAADDKVVAALLARVADLEADDAADEEEKARLAQQLDAAKRISAVKATLRWVPCNDTSSLEHWGNLIHYGNQPDSAVVCRCLVDGDTFVGMVFPGQQGQYANGCVAHFCEQPHVLVGDAEQLAWEPIPAGGMDDDFKARLVVGGYENGGKILYCAHPEDNAAVGGKFVTYIDPPRGFYPSDGAEADFHNPCCLVVKAD